MNLIELKHFHEWIISNDIKHYEHWQAWAHSEAVKWRDANTFDQNCQAYLEKYSLTNIFTQMNLADKKSINSVRSEIRELNSWYLENIKIYNLHKEFYSWLNGEKKENEDEKWSNWLQQVIWQFNDGVEYNYSFKVFIEENNLQEVFYAKNYMEAYPQMISRRVKPKKVRSFLLSLFAGKKN